MNKTLMILLPAILAGSQMVKADEPAWYGSLNFGVTLPEGDLIHEDADYAGAPRYKLKNGGVVGIGAGYAFGNGLRLEGELRARRFDAGGSTHNIEGRFGGPSTADGRFRSAALMTNLSYDFLVPNSKLRPYVKGGLGIAWNNAEADLYDSSGIGGWRKFPDSTDAQFAWSLGAGAAYPLNDRVALTAEYQYIDLGSAETDADIDGHRMRFDDLGSHEVTIGLRYTF